MISLLNEIIKPSPSEDELKRRSDEIHSMIVNRYHPNSKEYADIAHRMYKMHKSNVESSEKELSNRKASEGWHDLARESARRNKVSMDYWKNKLPKEQPSGESK